MDTGLEVDLCSLVRLHHPGLDKWEHGRPGRSRCPSRLARPLGTATWVSGPGGRLEYLNSRAETLLGLPARECLGSRCHRIIAATDPWGRPICGRDCPILALAGSGHEFLPTRMCILDRDREEHWVRVMFMDVGHIPGDRRLVHSAMDDTHTRRMEEYLEGVAMHIRQPARAAPERPALTPREREVLRRLEEAQSLHEIAARLGVRYATVRNHVQHLLTKLEVHSIQEAVARDLLDDAL
jgi:DNA-binding CsgD family transcriptional regulator